MKIDLIYNGIHVNAAVKSGVNILIGDSGIGKSLFMIAVLLYCKQQNISCTYVDYKSEVSEDILRQMCKDKQMILLDNADLYLTDQLLTYLYSSTATVFISLKQLSKYNCRKAKFLIQHMQHCQVNNFSYLSDHKTRNKDSFSGIFYAKDCPCDIKYCRMSCTDSVCLKANRLYTSLPVFALDAVVLTITGKINSTPYR